MPVLHGYWRAILQDPSLDLEHLAVAEHRIFIDFDFDASEVSAPGPPRADTVGALRKRSARRDRWCSPGSAADAGTKSGAPLFCEIVISSNADQHDRIGEDAQGSMPMAGLLDLRRHPDHLISRGQRILFSSSHARSPSSMLLYASNHPGQTSRSVGFTDALPAASPRRFPGARFTLPTFAGRPSRQRPR